MPDGFAKTGYWIQQAQRLILAPDGLTRDALAEQLYLQQRTSRTAISVLVNRLHKAIGQDGPWAACGGLIGSQQGRYRLNPQLAIRTDLDEFQAAWQTGGQPAGDEARLNAYRRLVTPYGGPSARVWAPGRGPSGRGWRRQYSRRRGSPPAENHHPPGDRSHR